MYAYVCTPAYANTSTQYTIVYSVVIVIVVVIVGSVVVIIIIATSY